ncbi:hypothetical protein, partial [Stenotrophomonas maltophilia]|uniref:hypothetical protein n=1 Tax=Stenotrophomonas maltophilia TaxID=40324 RepID=UPI001954B474
TRESSLRWQAAAGPVGRHADPLGLDAVHDYFSELYWQKGEAARDAARVGERVGILPAISERASDLAFPFKSIAEAFRMIDD